VIVREGLVAHPRVLEPSAPVQQAAELLRTPGVRSVLVVEGDRLVGSVTGAGVIAAVADDRDLRALSVGEISNDDVITIEPDAPLEQALHLMVEHDLERLAVVDEGRFVGVLPREPVLRRLAEDEPPPPED
jgi:tRNA nucleotidyltransferase (CCA-adding enzyme)